MASSSRLSSASKKINSGQSVSLLKDEPVTFLGSYAWTCHHCTNINIVDARNNERGYNGNICEHESCKHRRCIKCGGTNETTSTLDRLPIRRGIRRYECAFRDAFNCRKCYTTWLDAEKCARTHYTGSPFVSCTVPTCVRNFASLDHFREHLQVDHSELVERAPSPRPVDYPVLYCPFRVITHCDHLSYTLEELQEHFEIHMASAENRPKPNYVRDCIVRADGKYECRYKAIFDCALVFNTPLPEKAHLIKHFHRLMPCPLCEKEFRLPEWVAEHMKRHAYALKPNIGEASCGTWFLDEICDTP